MSSPLPAKVLPNGTTLPLHGWWLNPRIARAEARHLRARGCIVREGTARTLIPHLSTPQTVHTVHARPPQDTEHQPLPAPEQIARHIERTYCTDCPRQGPHAQACYAEHCAVNDAIELCRPIASTPAGGG